MKGVTTSSSEKQKADQARFDSRLAVRATFSHSMSRVGFKGMETTVQEQGSVREGQGISFVYNQKWLINLSMSHEHELYSQAQAMHSL